MDESTEAPRRLTRSDLLRSKGIDPVKVRENMQREEEKREVGCVVRSLASALSATEGMPVQATEEEWDMRLDEIKRSKSMADIAVESITRSPQDVGEAAKKIVREEMDKDRETISNMIKQMGTHDSPMGNAIRQVELSRATLSPDAIKKTIEDGNQIIINATILNSNGDLGLHAAHIGLQNDKFVSLSDSSTEVDLRADLYSALVISKKN